MKSRVNVKWNKKMQFEAEVNGFKIVMDTVQEFGGDDHGPRPKPLMLAALGGCTGMDVVAILNKMQVEFENLNIIVDGEMTEDHPKYYQTMHVIYEFKGKNLPLDKIQKAVDLSEQKYCGVGALYRKAIPVTSEIKIVE